jgi:peptide/nickel transport system permease protein
MQYLIWLTGNDWMWWKNLDYDDDGQIDSDIIRYGVLRGDFGRSIKYKRPTMDLIGERIPATLELGVAALVVSLTLGVPIGILAAIWRGGFFDNFTRIAAVVGSAVPIFWLGLMLLMFIGVGLDQRWARGNQCDKTVYSRQPCPAIFLRLEYLLLPTLVLAYGGVAGYSRYMRTAMLDTINSDYVRTARAKGLPPRTVWFRHAARNAMIPLATFLGPALVGVLGGAAITESIFSWPGLGRLLVEAVSGRDYPLVMASVVIGAVLTIVAFIISDLTYAIVDPRIRF